MQQSSSRSWWLSDGEAFIADLARLGVEEVESPWPAADARGGFTWFWWSPEQLLRRAELVTTAAIAVYKELVELIAPSLGPELPTYAMLPARIVGSLVPGDPDAGFAGAPRLEWFVEPIASDQASTSEWYFDDRDSWLQRSDWESRRSVIERLRSGLGRSLTGFGGLEELYSSTPAASLALHLFAGELANLKWLSNAHRHSEGESVRPRFL